MTPEDTLKALDHASAMSDRWLFLAAIAFICLCGMIIIRYLVGQNEKQSTNHNELMTKVVVVLHDATEVLKDVREFLDRRKE